jgi:hypothetical protein
MSLKQSLTDDASYVRNLVTLLNRPGSSFVFHAVPTTLAAFRSITYGSNLNLDVSEFANSKQSDRSHKNDIVSLDSRRRDVHKPALQLVETLGFDVAWI